MTDLRMSVRQLRSLGVEARWGRLRNGAPGLFVRNPQHRRTTPTWWFVDKWFWRRLEQAHQEGRSLADVIDSQTALAEFFSMPA